MRISATLFYLQRKLPHIDSKHFLALIISALLLYIGPSLNFIRYIVIGGKFRAAFRETFSGLLSYCRKRMISVWQRASARIWTTELATSHLELHLGVTSRNERDAID